MLVIALFAFGKLPVGEPRLNAFTIPSVSILIIYLLDKLETNRITENISKALAIFLLAGVTGNIYTTFFAAITGPEYAKKMNIYRSSEKAITLAQAKKIPILITPGIAYPYEKTRNLPYRTTVPGDWVLMTLPAYKVEDQVPVYAIEDMDRINEYMNSLPDGVNEVVAGDGQTFRVVNKGKAIKGN